MVEPFCATELATTTAISDGTLLGGWALLPVCPAQVPPHVGVVGLNAVANPLKLFGAKPPLSRLSSAQSEPQKVTVLPSAALRSPITKLPPTANGPGVLVAVGVRVTVAVAVSVLVLVGVAVAVFVGVAV